MTTLTASPPTAADRLHGLRRWNAGLSVLHLIQALAILALSSSFSLPVTSSFLRMDGATNRLTAVPDELFRVRIGPLVAAFLLISAIAHAALASPRLHAWYERNLTRGIQTARWIEYSLSSSLMMVVIAMLVGIYDIASLILIFALNATMILFGWIMELHNQTTTRTNWTAYWFGSFAGIVPWIAVAIYLIGAQDPPAFVYAIYASIFAFFNIFALNMLLQYRRAGRWREYLYGERGYMLLSLFAKSALAWQVFAGTLQPRPAMPYSPPQSRIARTRSVTRVSDLAGLPAEAAGDGLLAVHQPPGWHAPASGAPIQIADAAPEYPACVLVADDHPPRWQELSELLDAQPELRVIAAVSSVEEALATAERELIDAVVVDQTLGDHDGLWVSRGLLPGGDLLTRVRRLEREQIVRSPLREVFEFFSRAAKLESITPPWLRFRLLTPAGVEMRAGVDIEYRLRLHGIPLRWTSLIEVWERDARFVDLEIRGPYRLWRHEHRFTAVDGGAATRVHDRVDYLLPFGRVGRLALPLVHHDLRRIFDYRQAAVARLLG